MMNVDIAKRVYDHGYRLDPIIRSLADNDFYKLLMTQLIRAEKPDTRVAFTLINRNHSVRLAEVIDERELREQLDHARTLRFTRRESTWIAGNSFYGRKGIFKPDYLAWLEGFRLPEYEVTVRDGQFELTFDGPWCETSMWEVPALAILNELRSRAVMRGLGRFELDVLYSRAKAKLWDKALRLRALEGLKIADFGTRRRHSHLWQRWCLEAMGEGLGDAFTGTSNVLLAMEYDLEATGTNAHELPMVYAALAGSDAELLGSSYKVLEAWRRIYDGNLLVVLPDAFGTTEFLRRAPDWIADWTGFRPDSKPPVEGGEEILAWWVSRGVDPREKLLVFSDGLDVGAIEEAHRAFNGRVRLAFGWGTNLTNDFEGCSPREGLDLKAISLVCKVSEAEGRPAVKLSDNVQKATGPAGEIQRYLRVFGGEGRGERRVSV